MKLTTRGQPTPTQEKITRKFAEYNLSVPVSRGRKVPDKLKRLAMQGYTEGSDVDQLALLTGMSRGTMYRWIKEYDKTAPSKKIPVRKLAVVTESSTPAPAPAPASIPIVVRLTSGVTIEFANSRLLDTDFLRSLCALGVGDASSC